MVYPPGVGAVSYHHDGAESSVYVLSGGGKCCAKGQSFPVRQGDLIYFADREPHFLTAAPESELRFLVFYAPGVFKTIWADPSKVSTWASTGRDINGLAPLGSDAGTRGIGHLPGVIG